MEIVKEKQFLEVENRIEKMSEFFGLTRLEMQEKAKKSGLLKDILKKDNLSQTVTRE